MQETQGIEFSDRYELALNLYPKIKNFMNEVNEKPSFVPEEKTIQDINIPEDPYALYQKGSSLHSEGKYEEAIESLDKALDIFNIC